MDHYSAAGYYATVDAQLPDGRQVIATLYEAYEENHHATRGLLNLTVGHPCAFVPSPGVCAPAASGWANLTGDQIEFDRGLRGASLDDVTLTLWTPGYYLPGSGVPGGLPPSGDVPPGDGTLPPPMPPEGAYSPPVLVPVKTKSTVTTSVVPGTRTGGTYEPPGPPPVGGMGGGRVPSPGGTPPPGGSPPGTPLPGR